MSDSWAIELKNLTKRFGNLIANDQINLKVKKGSIHGIIGENGAGKSTAMKMLYGIYTPDSGEIRVNGKSCKWKNSGDAISAGIGMVHQHFMLSGTSSALENVLLFDSRVGFLKSFFKLPKEKIYTRLKQLSQDYGMPVDWSEPIERLPVGVQQRIEILKLLYQNAEILILDEPTAVLTPQEIQGLFKNLRDLKAQGKTILIITHKLREVMEITDRVTVFRAGQVTGEVETKNTNPHELAKLMVGRSVVLQMGDVERLKVDPPSKVLLKVDKISCKRSRGGTHLSVLDEVSFELKAGEILGIAGVEGNGQSELIQAILHPNDPNSRTSGKVFLDGQDISQLSTAKIRKLGLSCVPEDRQKQGLLLDFNLKDNFLLGLQRGFGFSRFGFLSQKQLEQKTTQALTNYNVRPLKPDTLAGKLSGGNQQKVIIAREFEPKPKVLIVAQPTRGVDVGAIEFIYQQLLDARNRGMGILLISSELDEILSLSDRLLVFYRGRVYAQFERGKWSEQEVGLKMGGI